ncbi:MAG TPA: hypothetical protein VMW08_08040 [Acidimicrobiales bacterium]|nr:hypothetical protein [Acidimicrobiales bacterium]
MTLSEALEQARRVRLGQEVADRVDAEKSPASEPTVRCEKCNCIGFPEMVDLVRGTVELVCPACQHVWVADRSVVPMA